MKLCYSTSSYNTDGIIIAQSPFWKKSLLQKEIICPKQQLFPFRVDLCWQGRYKCFCRVSFSTVVSISLNVPFLLKYYFWDFSFLIPGSGFELPVPDTKKQSIKRWYQHVWRNLWHKTGWHFKQWHILQTFLINRYDFCLSWQGSKVCLGGKLSDSYHFSI